MSSPNAKPLNKGVALLLTVVTFFAAGGLNEAFVLKAFGDLGGLIIDVLGLYVIIEIWRKTRRPKGDEKRSQ